MLPDIQGLKDSANLPEIVEGLTGHPGRGGLYHCPICGSGDGPNHTGAFHILPDSNDQSWYCHSCHRSGDVLDLAGYLLQTDDLAEKVAKVQEWSGAAPELTGGRASAPAAKAPRPSGPSAQDVERERAYVARSRLAIGAPAALDYLAGRGIGPDEARTLGLGYDPERDRIVIPFPGSDHYHTDRAVGHDGNGKYLKPKNLPQPIWNPAALDGDLVIAVEGPLDALALTLAGYGAQTVATCGTAWRALVDEIRARKRDGTVLVAFDDDGDAESEDPSAWKGRGNQRRMVEALIEAGVAATGLTSWAKLGAKDAAEAWQMDPDALRRELDAAVPAGVAAASEARAEAQERRLSAGLTTVHVVDSVQSFQNVVLLSGASDPVSTGLPAVDKALGGGLYPGLYVLGATSSMGKTTFLGQIADAVATGGRGVVFVTLEQSAEEMAAKALSRTLATHLGPDNSTHDVSALDLLRPSWRKSTGATQTMMGSIIAACDAYLAETGGRVRYVVADREPKVSDVAAVAEAEARRLGEPPLVIVDYLQILAAPDRSLSDKQATDRNVSELRRLARDLGTPVVAVSSLNRASYSGAVTMEAYKESGAIEYASDVLIGIQPRGMGEELADLEEKRSKREGRKLLDETKRKDVRDVELTVLKNRWGKVTGHRSGVALTYYAVSNRFVESAPDYYDGE